MKLITESFKTHKTLNPKLFDENNQLKGDVRERLIEIANLFVESLKENNIPIKVLDYWLVGSNAAYNYTHESDVDIHIIVNLDDIDKDAFLLKLVYEYAKSAFNSKYDIKVKGNNVELYVEDINTSAITNGIYSLLKNEWIKVPSKPQSEIEINIEDTPLYKDWYAKYQNLSDEEIDTFIDDLYILRKASLLSDGEFGDGNLVFKQFRNNGYLDILKDRKYKIKSRQLTLEQLEKDNGVKH